ncbi:MAG: PAS domain S-box protein [Planctomycetota bacterium]|nr:PAS domain S-box protein [Planctomycetota bacterium]
MERTRYRVLLVEDDRIDQVIFKRFVENEGLPYDCTVAGSVSEARSILACEQFDIIVSDYWLGDGTALDILNLAKNIPIILTTGAADEQVAIKVWKAGAYDYLPKDHEHNYLKALPKAIENVIRRRKVEEALDRKQKDLEAIFNAAPVGMLLANESRVVMSANNAIVQMFHGKFPQIIGKPVGNVLGCVNSTHNEKGCGYSRACAGCLLKDVVENVLSSGLPVHNVEIHPTLEIDNEEITFWLCISVEPVDIAGRRHVIVAIDDITERKKAEVQRRLAEERYRVIFENSAVAISMVDEQERLISWNKFMEGLLGMDEEYLYLRPVMSLYPAREWERMRACNVRQKGMQHHLETKMVRKDGTEIDVDISLSVLKDSEGKSTGSIGVVRDITERKKAEEKLKETMELKSQFISTVSHELRTPLTAMKEGLGIVLDEVVGQINEKQRKFLDIAKKNADRLNDLINDVLDFQKLKAGRMKLDIQSNDIEDVLSEVHETMALHAKKDGVKLSFASGQELPEARFDRRKIIQVLTNLVSNAIKFTPEKGRVAVNVRHQNEDWVIGVSDTGVGIPKESLRKIFERFYRVQRRREQVQGTGLGLAIVHEIVMMHGGRIEVSSELDRGTTFTVFLPLDPNYPPEVPSEEVDRYLENAVVTER